MTERIDRNRHFGYLKYVKNRSLREGTFQKSAARGDPNGGHTAGHCFPPPDLIGRSVRDWSAFSGVTAIARSCGSPRRCLRRARTYTQWRPTTATSTRTSPRHLRNACGILSLTKSLKDRILKLSASDSRDFRPATVTVSARRKLGESRVPQNVRRSAAVADIFPVWVRHLGGRAPSTHLLS